MSTNTGSGASPQSQPRLGPSWRSTSTGGRGFQPPSAEPDDIKNSNRNSFSLLDMDDDAPVTQESNSRKFTSRSEGLRSSGAAGGAFAGSNRSTRTSGRSLSDLASRLPAAAPERSTRSGSRGADDTNESGRSASFKEFDDKNVIRFTREKLLSMRPRVDPNNSVVPEVLSSLENSLLLSASPQDPGKCCYACLHCYPNVAKDMSNPDKKNPPPTIKSVGIPLTPTKSGHRSKIAKKNRLQNVLVLEDLEMTSMKARNPRHRVNQTDGNEALHFPPLIGVVPVEAIGILMPKVQMSYGMIHLLLLIQLPLQILVLLVALLMMRLTLEINLTCLLWQRQPRNLTMIFINLILLLLLEKIWRHTIIKSILHALWLQLEQQLGLVLVKM